MQRNKFIDVLKGILAIFVIILHFPIEATVQQKLLFPFWINMTVPCFMVLSGYVYAVSFQKRNLCRMEQMYEFSFLTEKLLRFVVPYSIAFVAEWIVFRIFKLYLVNVRTYGLLALFMDYLRGGKGQGSYYFPIMIQFVLIFPVIYTVIRRYQLKGLALCFGANAAYEILKTAYGMNDSEYRLLVFRYLFVIAAGCYFAIREEAPSDKKGAKKTILYDGLCIFIGALFIYLFAYTNYNPKIIVYWRTTSFLPCLFIVPILHILIQKVHWSFRPLEVVGKASFHIFLIQMIYYIFAEKMYALLPTEGLYLPFNIINCVLAGVIFYSFESPLSKCLLRKLKTCQKRKSA